MTRQPAWVDERRQLRQENELAGGVGRGQHPDHQALPLPEPARRDVGRKIGADKPGRRAPTTTPHSSTSCHGSMHRRRQRDRRAAVSANARLIVRRTPKRSITAAANGPIRP